MYKYAVVLIIRNNLQNPVEKLDCGHCWDCSVFQHSYERMKAERVTRGHGYQPRLGETNECC